MTAAGAPSQDGARAGAAPATQNNFNLLRLVFAAMVVAYHATMLPGVAAWAPAEAAFGVLAELGVQGFFVLSGYLVYASLERSASLRLYAEKRVRRLYPAYATVVIVCALAALAFSEAARADLAAVGAYLGWNLVFLNFMTPGLPGVFEANRFAEVNGALWTLKIEVMFYLVLPALAALLKRAGRHYWLVLAVIYVGAEVWRIGLEAAGQARDDELLLQLSRQLPGQMSFFATGIALRMAPMDGRRLQMAGMAGAGLLVLSLLFPVAEPLRAVGLGSLAIFLALGAPRTVEAARFGDLSYGVYIVHFPIIQTYTAAGLFATPLIGLGASLVTALALALLLWHGVEKPALRADSAYRKAA